MATAASASFLIKKTSSAATAAAGLDKSEWVKGQSLHKVSVVKCTPSAPSSSLCVKASSYADELIKTAVRTIIII